MTDTPASRRSRWFLVPPPVLFAAAFLAGIGLTRVVPRALLPQSVHAVGCFAGIALIAAAALFAGVAPALFVRYRTTIVPHGKARTLVTAGPFRITRNPMYLGFAIAYVGFALIANLIWPLVFLVVPLAALHTRIIPFEEATLTRIFGDEYRNYQQRVRRWL